MNRKWGGQQIQGGKQIRFCDKDFGTCNGWFTCFFFLFCLGRKKNLYDALIASREVESWENL